MTRKRFFLQIILIIVACTSFMTLQRKVAAKKIDQQTQAKLKGYLHDRQINGLILVNGKGKQPLVIRNTTTTDRKQVIKENQLFPIGSLQKFITGVATYQLVQKKGFDWNTQLSKYYPQIPGSNQITVQQLMTHTSGLQNDGAVPDRPLKSEKEQENFFLHHFKVTNNHNWNYEDIDFEMLAAIIRHQTHQSYYHYVTKTIFKPLKLHQFKMIYRVKPSQIPNTMLDGVTWQQVSLTASSEIGAGDLLVSPIDYWNFIYNGVLKNQHLINTFISQPKSQREAYFGGVYFQGNTIRANGSEPGYNCCFFADYKTKRTLMLFTNNIDYKTLRQSADDLYQIYYGEHIQP